MREPKARGRDLAVVAGALTATLALLTGVAPPAAAGGPTSVLVASPQTAEVEGLYYSEKQYAELQQLLEEPGTGSAVKPPEADLTNARLINVTWMLHDVTPWRHDQLHASSREQDIWIHTATDVPESMKGHWHRAAHPTRLRALLKELGVMGPASDPGYAGVAPEEELAEGPGAGPGSSTGKGLRDKVDVGSKATAVEAGRGGVTGWWWAIPGAAAGAVLALVLRPLAARIPSARLHREPGPRQELRDL
ncbi:hypothetical protein ACIHCM_15365 [Streptomyces sp. NPDC052023]|uniref:hypothetical protein n=1 Tax=Streptomyces sp. NPDC052023 TaxID=3365681 RepID=UPI0037D1DA0C